MTHSLPAAVAHCIFNPSKKKRPGWAAEVPLGGSQSPAIAPEAGGQQEPGKGQKTRLPIHTGTSYRLSVAGSASANSCGSSNPSAFLSAASKACLGPSTGPASTRLT